MGAFSAFVFPSSHHTYRALPLYCVYFSAAVIAFYLLSLLIKNTKHAFLYLFNEFTAYTAQNSLADINNN